MYATSVRNMRGCCVCCLYDNLVVKGLALSADCPDHIKLFRRYVSRKAAGKARAVLEGVGLETSTIDACFSAHPLNDEEIVQAGLVKWRDGQGNKQPPTWEVLISAMEYAGVAQQHVKELKEKLALPVKEPKVYAYINAEYTFGKAVLQHSASNGAQGNTN